MDRLVDSLERATIRATRVIALIGLAALLILAIITMADVGMRWLFNSPLEVVADTNRLMVAIVIATFFPMAIAERHHVTIRFLGTALGPRASAWLDLFGSVFTTAFFAVLAWQLILYTRDLFANGEATRSC